MWGCKRNARNKEEEEEKEEEEKFAGTTSSCNIEINRAGLRHPRILCKARFGAAVYIRQLAVNVENHEENINDSIESVSCCATNDQIFFCQLIFQSFICWINRRSGGIFAMITVVLNWLWQQTMSRIREEHDEANVCKQRFGCVNVCWFLCRFFFYIFNRLNRKSLDENKASERKSERKSKTEWDVPRMKERWSAKGNTE